jgi:hypothetical protein
VKEVVKDFSYQGVKGDGMVGINAYSVWFSILNNFSEQWRLIKMGSVYTVQDVVTADEEVRVLEEPCMMFDENGGWIRFVGGGINDRVKTRSRREKHNE